MPATAFQAQPIHSLRLQGIGIGIGIGIALHRPHGIAAELPLGSGIRVARHIFGFTSRPTVSLACVKTLARAETRSTTLLFLFLFSCSPRVFIYPDATADLPGLPSR